jgi:hypothetical protein
LDSDVLEFFRKQRGHYQTQINAVLRAYMEAQSRNQVQLREHATQGPSENTPRKDLSRSQHRSRGGTSDRAHARRADTGKDQ